MRERGTGSGAWNRTVWLVALGVAWVGCNTPPAGTDRSPLYDGSQPLADSGGSGGADARTVTSDAAEGGTPNTVLGCSSGSVIACDDFEGQGFDARWQVNMNGVTTTLDTSRAARGKQSVHMKRNSNCGNNCAADGVFRTNKGLPPKSNRLWVRAFVYVPAAAKDSYNFHSNLILVSGDKEIGGGDNRIWYGAATYGQGSSPTVQGFLFDLDRGIDEGSAAEPIHKDQTQMPLPLDKWFCLEGSFDAAGKEIRVYIDGTELPGAYIKAPAGPVISTLEFGLVSLAKEAWYDAVGYSETRIGCAD